MTGLMTLVSLLMMQTTYSTQQQLLTKGTDIVLHSKLICQVCA